MKTKKMRQADKHEKASAAEYGTKATPRSGAGRTCDIKGDSTNRFITVENKSTKAASRKVGGEELRKIVKEAFAMGKEPVLEIELLGLNSTIKRWAVIPHYFFAELLELYYEENKEDE